MKTYFTVDSFPGQRFSGKIRADPQLGDHGAERRDLRRRDRRRQHRPAPAPGHDRERDGHLRRAEGRARACPTPRSASVRPPVAGGAAPRARSGSARAPAPLAGSGGAAGRAGRARDQDGLGHARRRAAVGHVHTGLTDGTRAPRSSTAISKKATRDRRSSIRRRDRAPPHVDRVAASRARCS